MFVLSVRYYFFFLALLTCALFYSPQSEARFTWGVHLGPGATVGTNEAGETDIQTSSPIAGIHFTVGHFRRFSVRTSFSFQSFVDNLNEEEKYFTLSVVPAWSPIHWMYVGLGPALSYTTEFPENVDPELRFNAWAVTKVGFELSKIFFFETRGQINLSNGRAFDEGYFSVLFGINFE